MVALVESLLRDGRLEVREAAGETLSGLIHCGFATIHLEKVFSKLLPWTFL